MCKYWNYVEYLLILVSAVIGCVSIFAFPSLGCIPVGFRSSAIGLKIVQSLQESKGMRQLSKKEKIYDQIVLLGKTKLDTTEVLISKALIGLYISHDDFVSVNNLLREYNEMKEEIKSSLVHII